MSFYKFYFFPSVFATETAYAIFIPAVSATYRDQIFLLDLFASTIL